MSAGSHPLLVRSKLADHVSDQVTAIINAEIDLGKVRGTNSAASILAGVLLSLFALIRSSPHPRPQSLQEVERAVKACLDELVAMSDTAHT